MKKILFIASLSMLVVLLALGSVYAQSSNQGYNTPPQPGQGGGYGMGPGMMGGRGNGYGMGPGMMGPGQGYGPSQQYPNTINCSPKNRSIRIRPSLWLKII